MVVQEKGSTDLVRKTVTVLFLNIWGGHLFAQLGGWLHRLREVIDVFCFQEMCSCSDSPAGIGETWARVDAYQQLRMLLPDHEGYFLRSFAKYDYKGPVEYNLERGLAMFVQRRLRVTRMGELFVNGDKDVMIKRGETPSPPRQVQWASISTGEEPAVMIANVRGLWNGEGKGDSPERLEQSKKICTLLEEWRGRGIPVLLGGDLNLHPNTESLRMIGKGMHNLILERGITNTRSSYYKKAERYADYVFVSPSLYQRLRRFEVLKEEVSDHLAVLVEYC